MRRESHALSESLHRSGPWLDGYGYAMLAEGGRSSGRPTDVLVDGKHELR